MAYLMFREYGMLPSEYYKRPIGERVILSVFLSEKMKERR